MVGVSIAWQMEKEANQRRPCAQKGDPRAPYGQGDAGGACNDGVSGGHNVERIRGGGTWGAVDLDRH